MMPPPQQRFVIGGKFILPTDGKMLNPPLLMSNKIITFFTYRIVLLKYIDLINIIQTIINAMLQFKILII